jgi:Rrf2 family protein
MASIIQISEAASLAFHSMAFIAKKGETCSVKEIAQGLGVSEAHLAKVLQRLSREGLVNSLRGPKGGFTLAKAEEEITLLDVYQAIEGPLSIEHCLMGRDKCLFEKCLFNGFLENMTSDFKEYLSTRKLSDVT